MYDTPSPNDLSAIDSAIDRATDALMGLQRDDGHWVFELEADATIPAEFVLLKHYLGEPEDLELERRIGVYLRRIQADHGGWPGPTGRSPKRLMGPTNSVLNTDL